MERSDIDFTQKHPVALVTGASQGIGKAIAEKLAQAGYRLLLAARNHEKLHALKADLLQKSPDLNVEIALCDVRSASEVKAAVEKALVSYGQIDVLVNNAGVAAKIGLLQELSLEDIDRTIDTNIKGAIYAMRAVLPAMAVQGSGTIININSVAGKTAFPFWAVYDASKYALRALSEAVAEEQRANGVRVVGIYPGAVNTEIWDALERQEAIAKDGMLQADAVASAVMYVLSQPQNVFISDITLAPLKPAL